MATAVEELNTLIQNAIKQKDSESLEAVRVFLRNHKSASAELNRQTKAQKDQVKQLVMALFEMQLEDQNLLQLVALKAEDFFREQKQQAIAAQDYEYAAALEEEDLKREELFKERLRQEEAQTSAEVTAKIVSTGEAAAVKEAPILEEEIKAAEPIPEPQPEPEPAPAPEPAPLPQPVKPKEIGPAIINASEHKDLSDPEKGPAAAKELIDKIKASEKEAGRTLDKIRVHDIKDETAFENLLRACLDQGIVLEIVRDNPAQANQLVMYQNLLAATKDEALRSRYEGIVGITSSDTKKEGDPTNEAVVDDSSNPKTANTTRPVHSLVDKGSEANGLTPHPRAGGSRVAPDDEDPSEETDDPSSSVPSSTNTDDISPNPS